jgi:hypothetical protein
LVVGLCPNTGETAGLCRGLLYFGLCALDFEFKKQLLSGADAF